MSRPIHAAWCAALFLTGACSLAALANPFTRYLSIQPVGVPDDSLRVLETVGLASRAEIVGNKKEIYKPLVASGIPTEEIVDGSVGAGVALCCGADLARTSKSFFFIPRGLQIEVGDIVEVRSGRVRSETSPGLVNRAKQVRQRKQDRESGVCRWDPPDQALEQILHCEWMPDEGWVKESQNAALPAVWIKRATQ